jgi:hypothetical protein
LITNGIEIRCDADYNKLPLPAALRSLIREVHSHTGDRRYEMRYSHDGPTSQASERRSSPARTSHIQRVATKEFDVARERLRLRLEVMRRVSG